MLADKLLGQLISATERQNRKVDVTNRLLGLMAKVKPGNLNTATSVPVASASPKQGSMNGIGSSDNNENFIKLIEYSKITSENSVKTSDLTEKMLKVIESKFGLFNSNLIDIKEAIEEEDPPEKEDKPKEKFNFFKEVEQDLKADYGRVKENILDFVVPGRARKKKEQEELSKKEKENKEPKRPKVIPLVATPIQTAVANVDQQSRSFDTSPIVKAMDKNTLRLIDKLDELKSAQGEGGGSILGDLGGALGGAALLSKAGGAIKGGAAALGRGASAVGRAVLPRVAAGAATLAGGAALPLALGAAAVGGVAYLESTAGKDEQGNDLKVDEKQDEANWQKMTVGQKVQSGLARGIEKIGDTLFLGNMARQARVERIKKETDYLQNNAKEVTASNEASTPSQKAEDIAPKEKVDIQFSEATFAQKDPENYKKFVEYRNKRSEEIYNKRAEKFTSSTSEQRKETTKQISQDLAKRDAVLKFKGEIEAAGAGSVKVTNQEKQITTEANTSETNSSKSSDSNVNPSTPSQKVTSSNEASTPSQKVTSSNEASTPSQKVTSSNEASTPSQKAVNNISKEKVDIKFSELKFMENDNKNYKKFVEYRNKRTEEIYNKGAERLSPTASIQTKENLRKKSENDANRDAVLKFKGEIEAAGAGSVKIENKNQSVTTNNTTNTASSTSNVTNSSSNATNVNNATNATNSSSNATNVTNVTNATNSSSNVNNNLSQPPNVSSKEVIKGTFIAGEPVVPDKPLSEKQLSVMKMSMEMGNTYSSDILKKYTEQTGIVNKSSSVVNVSPSKVNSVQAPVQPGMIKELTTINQETSRMSAPPIIVNNVNNQAAPSQGSNSVQSLSSVPTSRNTNSTIERVMTKNAFFTLA